MGFKIRTAVSADIPGMHTVRRSVRENRLSDPQRVNEDSYLPYVEAGSAWVAETETAIAGFAAIDLVGANVWALFVVPSAEGLGIGQALHQRMLEWARQQGIPHLSLRTEAGSRAETFYERAGWTRSSFTSDGDAVFEKALTT